MVSSIFETIDKNKDVVKAVHYINCHWDSHPMWYENPTFKGIDARLQLSDTVSQRWLEITNKPPFILSSPSCTMPYMTINKKMLMLPTALKHIR